MTNLLALPIRWLMSLVWHLFMVAALRPQVARVGDSLFTFLSFALPFYVMGVLRWHVYGRAGLAYCLVNLTAAILVFRILNLWAPLRLVTFYLAISVVVDFVAIALLQGGVPFETLSWPWTQIAEVLMVLHVYRTWRKLPQAV
jgi:hypothetical protein